MFGFDHLVYKSRWRENPERMTEMSFLSPHDVFLEIKFRSVVSRSVWYIPLIWLSIHWNAFKEKMWYDVQQSSLTILCGRLPSCADTVGQHTSLEFMSPEKKFAKQVDGTTKFFGSNAKFWYLIWKFLPRAFGENRSQSYTMNLYYNAPKNHQKLTFCQFSPTRPSHSPIW